MTDDFFDLVRRMRDAQKRYFSTEHGTAMKREALEDSKSLERQVDKALARREVELQQGGLF